MYPRLQSNLEVAYESKRNQTAQRHLFIDAYSDNLFYHFEG